jgi:hypothetical protein
MADNLRETLLAYFASDLGLGKREVQNMLIEMDDEGDLLMKNGWYRLSERAKKDG